MGNKFGIAYDNPRDLLVQNWYVVVDEEHPPENFWGGPKKYSGEPAKLIHNGNLPFYVFQTLQLRS